MFITHSNPVERKSDAITTSLKPRSPELTIIENSVTAETPPPISREDAVKQAILRTG